MSVAAIALLAGGCGLMDRLSNGDKPAVALLPPAPLPEYAPGDTFIYRTGNQERREEVTALTSDTVAWTDDQGNIWTTAYDVVSPMISWQSDPELGRGRQNVISGAPADLFPLQSGRQVAFTVEGSSETMPAGWTMEQSCKVVDQAQVTVEAGVFNTFQISCQRSNHLETLYYSPVVQNYVLRVREYPFGTQRKELAAYSHADMPQQASIAPSAIPAAMAGGTPPELMTREEMQASLKRLEASVMRLEQQIMQMQAARAPGAPPAPVPPAATPPAAPATTGVNRPLPPRAVPPVPQAAAPGAPQPLAAQPTTPGVTQPQRPPAAPTTALPAPAAPGQENFGLHLGSYRALPAATRGWEVLLERYPDMLGRMKAVNSEFNAGDGRGSFIRLIASGYATNDQAVRACKELEAKRQFCKVVSLPAS